RKYVLQHARVLASSESLVETRFCLKNSGGAPAEGLEVEISASEGLILFHEEPTRELKRSKPPKRPRRRRAIDVASVLQYGQSSLPDLPVVPYRNEPPPARDPRSFYWEERGGLNYAGTALPLRLSCERFMHSGDVDETSVFVRPSIGCAGGKITASVSAANLPKFENFKLNVRLQAPLSIDYLESELRQRMFPAFGVPK
ncbi:MAG: hypothetical protein AAF658_17965, partial [Myxococcota bacterium]